MKTNEVKIQVKVNFYLIIVSLNLQTLVATIAHYCVGVREWSKVKHHCPQRIQLLAENGHVHTSYFQFMEGFASLSLVLNFRRSLSY